ncbi:MAG TPA: HRDC domain-containing protein [Solirubrobacteraceae bacterium]|nr:HRDC domain-containing protein [Solirubrobacteraceae bacterium]
MTAPSASGSDLSAASVLDQVAKQADAAGRIALDTEFMGEGRYRTLLCLIQLAVAVDEGDEQSQTREHPKGHTQRAHSERIEILDPLDGALQGEPLAQVLADPQIEVVVHAGRQDIALLRRTLQCEVRNVFDTQVAAGFLGMPAQSSYDTLLAEILGVRLAKSASFTRWDARPLSAEQLSYAREDVVHLTELAVELERRLVEAGRVQWAREECEFLEKVSDERDLDAIFARLPRVRGMSAASQNVARELVAWRERTAQERDKPVQSVLGDAALVEIAKRRPSTVRKLEEIRGVAQNSLRKRGEELLAAVQRGLQSTDEPLASDPRPAQPRPDDAPLIALSEALVRARAREAGLAYELLAARADLQAIVVGQRTGQRADVRTLRGWRLELVGEELLDLLDGRISLSVSDRRVRVSPS